MEKICMEKICPIFRLNTQQYSLEQELARNISAKATVLLKNNGILPLKPGKKVVLIGADASSPFVHGGGSGSVEPTSVHKQSTAAGWFVAPSC